MHIIYNGGNNLEERLMSVYIIPVATGEKNEMKFLELALNSMFMMEFRVDEH